MGIPSWVSEGSIRKYYRAVEQLRKEGKEATEDAIKALYVKWNGLVLDGPVVDEETEEVEEAPKRRGRKAA